MENPFDVIDTRLRNIESLLLDLKKTLDELRPTITEVPIDELFTRQQVAEKLKISLPTLGELTKNGKIIGYRIGNRVRYKASEVQQALTKIKTGGKL